MSKSLTSNSFAGSYPFCFIVGPRKETFYAHSELVAGSSNSLYALVNGAMIEANQRCATFEDVDEDTVVQFIEFLYTKDYTVPDPKTVLEPSDIVHEVDGEKGDQSLRDLTGSEDSIERKLAFISKKSKKRSKKPQSNRWREESPPEEWVHPAEASPPAASPPAAPPPAEEMYLEDIPGPQKCKRDRAWMAFTNKAEVLHRKSWEPRQNTESCEEYTEVFLCHARLYVFSDRHGIESLRELSLQKLRLTLSKFHLFDERVPDVVELVSYTYRHTMEHDRGIDKLRNLVMDYVICNLEIVFKNKNFKQMLIEAGALSKDLVWKTLERLD